MPKGGENKLRAADSACHQYDWQTYSLSIIISSAGMIKTPAGQMAFHVSLQDMEQRTLASGNILVNAQPMSPFFIVLHLVALLAEAVH